ncbi:MAG: hypothetical protein P8L36_17055, partial [SAR324 cluster bacterium]|nr:hypothetical protein [SAR324 cluster bacterium]
CLFLNNQLCANNLINAEREQVYEPVNVLFPSIIFNSNINAQPFEMPVYKLYSLLYISIQFSQYYKNWWELRWE